MLPSAFKDKPPLRACRTGPETMSKVFRRKRRVGPAPGLNFDTIPSKTSQPSTLKTLSTDFVPQKNNAVGPLRLQRTTSTPTRKVSARLRRSPGRPWPARPAPGPPGFLRLQDFSGIGSLERSRNSDLSGLLDRSRGAGLAQTKAAKPASLQLSCLSGYKLHSGRAKFCRQQSLQRHLCKLFANSRHLLVVVVEAARRLPTIAYSAPVGPCCFMAWF